VVERITDRKTEPWHLAEPFAIFPEDGVNVLQ
jgi:hypothetical protein